MLYEKTGPVIMIPDGPHEMLKKQHHLNHKIFQI